MAIPNIVAETAMACTFVICFLKCKISIAVTAYTVGLRKGLHGLILLILKTEQFDKIISFLAIF